MRNVPLATGEGVCAFMPDWMHGMARRVRVRVDSFPPLRQTGVPSARTFAHWGGDKSRKDGARAVWVMGTRERAVAYIDRRARRNLHEQRSLSEPARHLLSTV
jgi:hypothetical protein